MPPCRYQTSCHCRYLKIASDGHVRCSMSALSSPCALCIHINLSTKRTLFDLVYQTLPMEVFRTHFICMEVMENSYTMCGGIDSPEHK